MIVDDDYVVSKEDIPLRDKYTYELYADEKCINEYILGGPVGADLNLYVKYISESLNKIIVNEKEQSVVGNADVKYTLSFATDKAVNTLYCFIKYPDSLTLKSVNAKDFANAELEDEYTGDGFKTAIILAQYSDTELIPKNEVLTPFELKFDVLKSAQPGTIQIEASEESCLIGNETYFFEERIPGTLEILPNNLKANIYTINIVCGSFTKTIVSEDKKSFTITPINVETGKTVILALYNGDKCVEIQGTVYSGEVVLFTSVKSYTKAKVMVWDDFTTLKPVCDVGKIN